MLQVPPDPTEVQVLLTSANGLFNEPMLNDIAALPSLRNDQACCGVAVFSPTVPNANPAPLAKVATEPDTVIDTLTAGGVPPAEELKLKLPA